ncbi:ras-related protein Rab-19 isoform X4 [Parambassis ranga]|uniref:Ras-related protein Rab-19 isoform X4 n=1 Tax=Parambassis ranga TaxID=210632 RepID=A0A6P7ILG1_9TELE|nr:ras-related protein Rab-19-like isoform X4 [Parambassis ranga]
MQWCRWAGSWRPHLQRQSAGSEIEDSFDFLFKIILVGDSDVGKTCVVQSFKSGIFIEKQQNTIGVDFTVRTLDIDGKKVKMQVWDTAGQERFRTITQSYYRSAHGAMVAYDISRRSTFESVPHWIREVEQYGAASVVTNLTSTLRDRCCLRMRALWQKITMCLLLWKPQPRRRRMWRLPSSSWPGSYLHAMA